MASMGQGWTDRLASMIAMATGPEAIAARVDDWADALGEDDRLPGELYRTGLHTHLAGQLMVRAIELRDEAGADGTVVLEQSATRAIGARDLGGAFLGMPFEEALAFFRDKRIMDEREFDALVDKYKASGFIARGLATATLRERAHAAIERMLAEGLSVQETVAAIRTAERDEVLALGITPAAPGYLETVVRTNTASAYGHGRWQAMIDPAVQRLRPWMQFWTAGDARVRAGHRALHGRVFESGSALAERYAPPLSWQCRCTFTTLSDRQLEARQIVPTTTRVAEIEAEEFWSNAPATLADEGA